MQYSWLWKLANVTQSPYSYLWTNTSTAPELVAGPSRRTMYVTALYFTMTCMTSVGFGNVAAETDNEKIFTICMMIIAGTIVACGGDEQATNNQEDCRRGNPLNQHAPISMKLA